MSPNKQNGNDQNNDKSSLTRTIASLANSIVLWIGIVSCLLYFVPFPTGFETHKELFQSVALSVGCSLIATYIATHYTNKSDRQPVMEAQLKRIEIIVNEIKNSNRQPCIETKLDRIESKTNKLFTMEIKTVMDILRRFGIVSDQYYRQNIRNSFPTEKGKKQVENSVTQSLENYRIDQKFTVGKLNPVEQDYYYDLIGGTCCSRNAEYFARMLSSYWNAILTDKSILRNPEFDFVVTPKGGSPLLGYEFAKLINRPFVLHEEKARFADEEKDVRAYFNFDKAPKDGATALIVDDSTTGGRMVSETVHHLRTYGYKVNTCLVVFAPQTKNAAEHLQSLNVQLISIVKTHDKQVEI